MQSYVTPHIEGKRYTNIGGSWAATIFSVKFHFFFYSDGRNHMFLDIIYNYASSGYHYYD